VSRSPVSRWSCAIAAFVIELFPNRHCVPGPSRLSWPSVFEASNAVPIAFGASHSAGDRAHSHAQSAYGLSGSCSAAFHSPQPQD